MKGDGQAFRRGKVYWYTYQHDGVRHRQSLKTTNAEEARDEIKRLRARLELGEGPAPRKRLKVGGLLDDLLVHLELKNATLKKQGRPDGLASLPKIKSHLKAVRLGLGHVPADALSTEDVERYQRDRLADGKQPATVKHESYLLGQAFRLAMRRTPPRIRRVPYIPPITVENARQGFLSRADFDALLQALEAADLRDYIEWFWWTGMRPKEIRSLTWAMFDEETWTLHLAPAADKMRKGRSLSVTGPLRTIIERRLEKRLLKTPLIFHRISKGRAGQPVQDYRGAWAAACAEVGLVAGRDVEGGLTPYDLRRTALRNMVRGGTDFTVAMKISGHRTRATFDRYNITSTEDIEAAIERTAAYVDALPTERKVARIRPGK